MTLTDKALKALNDLRRLPYFTSDMEIESVCRELVWFFEGTK